MSQTCTIDMGRHEKGAAILLALLLMTVLTTLSGMAITTYWGQQRASSILQQTMQHDALLSAGQRAAHAILVEDARDVNEDNLQEVWANQGNPMDVSTFLNSGAGEKMSASISNRIEDLTGKWNILSLRRIEEKSEHQDVARKIALAVGMQEDRIIKLVATAAPEGPMGVPGQSSTLRGPQSPEGCLLWLGFTPAEVLRSSELVTCLPEETAININTVNSKLLALLIDSELVPAFLKEREIKPFSSIQDAATRLHVPDLTFPIFLFSSPRIGWDIRSNWFAIHTNVTLDSVGWNTIQVVHRMGTVVEPLTTTWGP